MSPTLELLLALLVPMALGLIIGVERESSGGARAHGGLGGVRTFALIGLSGAMCGLLATALGSWLVGVGLVVVGGLAVVSRHRRATETEPTSMASEVSAIATFLLGVVATSTELVPDPVPRFQLTAALGVGVIALLALREPLHSLASQVTREDLYATVRFTVLALVVLPLLPDATYGPLDVLNPLHIGTMVVLVAGIGFAAYVAMRVLGARKGLLAAGLIGGLVSSTAVTVSLSRRARQLASTTPAVIAVIAACSTMFLRVVAELLVVDRALLPRVAPVMVAMTVAGVLVAVRLYRRGGESADGDHVEVRNPFELRSALKFGLVFALVVLMAKAADTYMGARGVYVSAAIAGLTDVDAITLSVASLHREGLSEHVAAHAIFIAAASNTAAKMAIAGWLGRGSFARGVVGGLTVSIVAGALVLLIQAAV